jgi:hypothetical protein
MGVFNRFREDVQRVGAELGPMIGGTLEGPGSDHITWHIAGTRGGRRVRIDLNHMHGIFGLACEIRSIGLESFQLRDDKNFFARSGVHVSERLKADSMWDAPAIWQLLPDLTRRAIIQLLAPESSSLSLSKGEVSALLGPLGLLRQPDATQTVLRDLDRLLALVPVLEEYWDVEPRTVGGGLRGGRPPAPPAPPSPPPPKVEPRDAAAVASRAVDAIDRMLFRFQRELIEPFPTVNPMSERESVKGRVVLLPSQAPSQWVSDLGYKVLYAGDVQRGWYFARSKLPGFARVLRAAERYERATRTRLDDTPYRVVARITGNPSLVVVDGKAHFGIEVDLLGAAIGDRVFIDATNLVGDESPFDGEH